MQETRIGFDRIRIWGPVGYYPSEQRTGNEFLIDIAVVAKVPEIEKDSLDNTVNYEAIYGVIQRQMQVKRKLLETAAIYICKEIKKKLPEVEQVKIRITKLNALEIEGEGDAFVEMEN